LIEGAAGFAERDGPRLTQELPRFFKRFAEVLQVLVKGEEGEKIAMLRRRGIGPAPGAFAQGNRVKKNVTTRPIAESLVLL